MKKFTKSMFPVIAIAILALTQTACDKGLLPNIAFKTGAGYTSADATVAKGAAIKVGIDASKAESADVLKTFNISTKFDGATSPTTVKSETLTGTQGDAYSTDFSFTTRNQAGTEVYIFTVTNRDGLIGTKELKLTVQ